MALQAKLVGNEDERAVSPVIGVILMVAITVILAAVIAAFVLDLGQSTGANAQAGIDFSEDSGNIDITITSVDRADEIRIADVRDSDQCEAQSGSSNWETSGDPNVNDDPSAGDTIEFGDDCNSSDGDTIQVIGVLDGNEAVIATYDAQS